ncbi:TetR family transcriptional regulator [Nocardia sp. NPDC050697]|uniref:TetR/AcrR family transcriptional regulator n=1 Tax=Nocardia sp. NPDC050697 TaxID=3155158 RepID=UPI00340D019C
MRIRDRLLLAAEQQFAERGVLETTLAQIREAAGASVGALYHHFPDKAELYRQVWIGALADFQAHFRQAVLASADAHGGVTAGVRAHLEWVTAQPARATVLFGAAPAGAKEQEGNREFLLDVARWWRTHAGYGAVRELEFDLLYALWLGPAQEYARNWLAGAIRRPPAEVAAELGAAAWRTLQNPD